MAALNDQVTMFKKRGASRQPTTPVKYHKHTFIVPANSGVDAHQMRSHLENQGHGTYYFSTAPEEGSTRSITLNRHDTQEYKSARDALFEYLSSIKGLHRPDGSRVPSLRTIFGRTYDETTVWISSETPVNARPHTSGTVYLSLDTAGSTPSISRVLGDLWHAIERTPKRQHLQVNIWADQGKLQFSSPDDSASKDAERAIKDTLREYKIPGSDGNWVSTPPRPGDDKNTRRWSWRSKDSVLQPGTNAGVPGQHRRATGGTAETTQPQPMKPPRTMQSQNKQPRTMHSQSAHPSMRSPPWTSRDRQGVQKRRTPSPGRRQVGGVPVYLSSRNQTHDACQGQPGGRNNPSSSKPSGSSRYPSPVRQRISTSPQRQAVPDLHTSAQRIAERIAV